MAETKAINQAAAQDEAVAPIKSDYDRSGRILSLFFKLLPAIALLVIWEVGAGRFVDTFYYSQPSSILVRLWQAADWNAYAHIRITLIEMLAGYAVGAIVGMVLGYAVGRSEKMSSMFEPYVLAFYSIPTITLAPLIIMYFGIDVYSKIIIVAKMVFFTVFYEVYLGIRSVNAEHVNLARLMGASERQVIHRIVLPSVFPYLMLGLRLGLPKMVIGAIAGEFVAAKAGIGYTISMAASNFDPTGIFAGITILLLLTMVINAAFHKIETRALIWTRFEHRMAED